MLHIVPETSQNYECLSAVIRLFRVWHAARNAGENPLPKMQTAIVEHGGPVNGAIACDSFFALTEASLGRKLVGASDQDEDLSMDEMAMLIMLQNTPVLEALGPNSRIPHGLPGALQWAAMAVLDILGHLDGLALETEKSDVPVNARKCPFGAGFR